MTTLGIKYWGWTVAGWRIGCSIESRRVCVGVVVVTCGTFAKGFVGCAHCWMGWWSACIDASLLLHAITGESRKAHVSVVTPWKMRSISVMSVRLRWWCLNSTVFDTWNALVDLATMVWHR